MAGPQDEHAGLSGLAKDVFGLSARGQMGWMQFQLFHMPSTWRQKVGGVMGIGARPTGAYGLNWRGPIGGRFAAWGPENIYKRMTGKSTVPFLSPLLRGTSLWDNAVSPLNTQAARAAFGEDVLTQFGTGRWKDFTQREFGRWQSVAARRGDILFGQAAGTGRYGTAAREIFSGSRGAELAGKYFGDDAAAAVAGRGLYRRAAGRTLVGGIGRLMYPVSIGLNLALVADVAIGLGTAMGRAASGIVNRLTQYNQLDFGNGVYVASTFQGSITERQRALQAIQRNNLNARRAIGGEAALLHS